MKKTILISACIIATMSNVFAQTDLKNSDNKKVRFGIRAGYEFQMNKSDLDYTLKLPYFGVFSEVKLSNRLSLQAELNLRSENRERILFNGTRASNNELYLTVPVFLKYRFSENFRIYGGTQILLAFINGKKLWNPIIGAEYNFNKHLYLDARFKYGSEGRNFRDNRLSLGLGYKF